jgi:hypothetical protein
MLAEDYLPQAHNQSMNQNQRRGRLLPTGNWQLKTLCRPPPPPRFYFTNRADYYAAGEENETAKAMNPRVLIEQNAGSGEIANVRENARILPNCKMRPI